MIQMESLVAIRCVCIRRYLLRLPDYDIKLKDHGFCNSVTNPPLIDLFVKIRLSKKEKTLCLEMANVETVSWSPSLFVN